MKVTMKSQLSGLNHTRELPISEQEFARGVVHYSNGAFIQDAFPMLSADDREFLLTGITPEEWDDIFSNKED